MKCCIVLAILFLSGPLAAQQPTPPRPPAAPKAPEAPAAPTPPLPAVDPEVGGQPINIRLDVSVVDQAASDAPQPKSLMVILVDRAMGRTRAAFQDRSIAVDARPTLVDGRIRVLLTIQSDVARDLRGMPESNDHTLNWKNSFSLLLESGKPMLALETTDPATKRTMSIEVKATIQK